ncbi:MAG: GLPGLI family protein [Bacteroidota bacterium]|nr:GLPGLI family protein [Bacteroidota bacterium]MDP3144738.1 GLPGLI family protein [Bacteroidota bacterium]
MTIRKILLGIIFCFISITTNAQITAAKITYERKTNLYKKLKGNTENWLKEEDKIKIDFFELYVNDTSSLFKPQESELRENLSWATSKNTVLQNFNLNTRYLIKTIWGEELHLTDSLFKRQWHITESSRKIAGYACRKAIWEPNDSTKIYAWFSYDITPSTGPESFNGLPGTILGIATEDGGVVYFAKKVELINPDAKVFILPKKKKVYAVNELKAQMEKQYGKEKWFKRMLNEQFGLW